MLMMRESNVKRFQQTFQPKTKPVVSSRVCARWEEGCCLEEKDPYFKRSSFQLDHTDSVSRLSYSLFFRKASQKHKTRDK